MKKALIVAVAAAFLLSGTASAQMMSGRAPGVRGGGQGGGMMGYTASDMLGMMGDVVVAPDGTVLTLERSVGTSGVTETIVAYSASGTKAWSFTGDGLGRVVIAGTQVLVTSYGKLSMHGANVTLPEQSEIISLNLSNGAKAWSAKLDGLAMNMQPSANQIYVSLLTPASRTVNPGQGFMMLGTRSLVALSNGGVVLWTKKLGV